MSRLTGSIVLFFSLSLVPAVAQEPFAVGPVTAGSGETASGDLIVAAAKGDAGTTIPISIVRGSQPGPVLALIAGIHGVEYPPILALERLKNAIDPHTLRGTVIIVHVANVPSFLARTVYYSPVDGKNLNRVFPGRAGGTLSERIADTITRQVIERATHVIDLHCGDGNESLRPYSYLAVTGRPELVEASRQLALAFGLDHIVLDRSLSSDPAKSLFVDATALTRGKPAITVESGGMGQSEEASIARLERGVEGVLRQLGMRPTGPEPVSAPFWIGRNEVLTSGATGIFYPAVERGRTIAAGTLIGRITDFHGATLQEIRAPFAGEVLYVIGTPPTTKGEPIAMIGAPATEAELRGR